MQVETIDAPAHWGSALVNRDFSSLNVSEAACVKEWVKKQGLGWPVSMSETFMGRHEGLLTEMATYAFLARSKKPPHEMTFAEFSAEVTAIRLGPNHGRQWELFFGTDSLGFADGPTSIGALRQVHKRQVNNALYSHMPGAVCPSGMEPKSMPPQCVLDEYPDLRAKFAPAIRAQQHDRLDGPYQQAVRSFVEAGGKAREAYSILDSELSGDFDPARLADALVFHGFAKRQEAAQMASAILDEERRNVLAKEDRKAGDLLA